MWRRKKNNDDKWLMNPSRTKKVHYISLDRDKLIMNCRTSFSTIYFKVELQNFISTFYLDPHSRAIFCTFCCNKKIQNHPPPVDLELILSHQSDTTNTFPSLSFRIHPFRLWKWFWMILFWKAKTGRERLTNKHTDKRFQLSRLGPTLS